jgi:inner membrane protein
VRAATHLAFAGLTGVVAAGFNLNPGTAGGAALAVGALLPDIDTTTSSLGKFVKPVSSLIERKVGHRTITHSFLGLGLLGLVSSPLLLLYPPAWTWLLIGAATHIVLDTANINGVPLFWPGRLEAVLFYDRSLRVPYGSPKEFTWLAVIALLALLLMPLSIDGFSPWFHRALGTTYGGVEDYLRWRNDYEVWAEVKGTNLITDEDVEGRFRVIDVLHTEQLLIEDEAGRAYTVGLGQESNIIAKRVAVWRGEKIVTSTYRVDLAGRLVSDLINSLPKGARRVHINAALNLKGAGDPPPVVGYFQRVKRFGEELEVRSATAGDLAPLSNLVIEAGSAVIRAEYSPGSEALADLSIASSIPPYRSHVLKIPKLPSLSGLLIEIGGTVEDGDLMARYVDDRVLEDARVQITEANERISDLEEKIQLERQAHQVELEGLHQTLETAQENLERTRFLVERGAEPRVRLLEAENTLKRAGQTLLRAETLWTSRLTEIDAQLRQARLTVTRAERTEQAEMEAQWVRSPVKGLVADVRLTGVSVKGFDLEVRVLEEDGVVDEVRVAAH